MDTIIWTATKKNRNDRLSKASALQRVNEAIADDTTIESNPITVHKIWMPPS